MTDITQLTAKEHARIIEQYRQACAGDWVRLTQDTEARRNLCTHLLGAGQIDTLYTLVAESADWAKARFAAEGNYLGYLADLHLARTHAETPHGWNIRHQIRCLLIESSLQELETNPIIGDEKARASNAGFIVKKLPPGFIAHAIALTRQIPDEQQRAFQFEHLLRHIPEEFKAEILNSILEIENETIRLGSLLRIIHILPESLKATYVPVALTLTLAQSDERARAQDLDVLLSELPDNEQEPALEIMEGVKDATTKLEIFSYRTLRVTDESRLEAFRHAIRALQDIHDEGERYSAFLSFLAERLDILPETLMPEVLAIAQGFADTDTRVKVYELMIHQLPKDLQFHAVNELLPLAVNQSDPIHKAHSLTLLVTRTTGDTQAGIRLKAWTVARSIPNIEKRASALMALEAQENPTTINAGVQEVLDTIQTIPGLRLQALRLHEFARRLPTLKDELMREAVNAALEVPDHFDKANAISILAPDLPNDLRESCIREALEATRNIESPWSKAISIQRLARFLSPGLYRETLPSTQEIPNEGYRAHTLLDLANHFPNDLKPELLKLVRNLTDDNIKASTIVMLARLFPAELQPQIWQEALQITTTLSKDETDYPAQPERFLSRNTCLLFISSHWSTIAFTGLTQDDLLSLLHSIAKIPRSEFLNSPWTSRHLFEHMGGQEALIELLYSIEAVGEWWP